jgi:hypothetical protein
MENICAVVDAQGFFISNKFYPREVAIVSDSISFCQEFNPKLKWDLLDNDQHILAKYCYDHIHGFKLNVKESKKSIIQDSENYIKHLSKFYKIIATESKQFYGIKNDLYDDLIIAGIPVINLSDKQYDFPSIYTLEGKYNNSYWMCAYHDNVHDGLRCSLRKCYNIWKHLKETLLFDNLTNKTSCNLKLD